ncbi:MAG: hypothetical protein H6933_18615 [Burkholderiaceae bacterium]|nr:hypothetical protein [Flavobacteriales bacterium]MCP5286907.1 hypothetical protein [Burkholderiaceae bacterium]
MNAPSDAALLIGLDSHGLAVARALASRGVPVYAIERDPRLPGVASRHLTGHFPVTDFSEEHLLPALRDTRAALKAHRHVVLFPMNDRQVGIVARHIGELSTLYRISWADAAATVLRLQRKDSLDDASRTQGLQYPRSVVLERAEDLRAVTGFRLPVILKPVMPLSSFKTHVVHSLDEARAFVAGKLSDLPILCQEYIEGGDDALFFGELLLDHGRPLFGMTGRKLLSHPPGQGQATVAETHANAEVLRLTAQFFAGSDLSGPAALELKRDPQGGFWVIEPTIGRTEFLVELCIAAGFNQPWMEFELACARPVEPPERLTDRVWYDTEREPLAYLRLSRQHRSLAPRGKAPVFPYWGHGDLRPWLRAMGHAIRMRWFRLWGR